MTARQAAEQAANNTANPELRAALLVVLAHIVPDSEQTEGRDLVVWGIAGTTHDDNGETCLCLAWSGLPEG